MHMWKCGFHYGLKLFIFGLLILINEFLLDWSWGLFLGLIFLVFGIIGLTTHGRCTCEMQNMMEMPKKAARRKR